MMLLLSHSDKGVINMEQQILQLNENDTVHLGNGATLTILNTHDAGEITFAIDGLSSMLLHDLKTQQLWRSHGLVRGVIKPATHSFTG
jgi:hypothetical protein